MEEPNPALGVPRTITSVSPGAVESLKEAVKPSQTPWNETTSTEATSDETRFRTVKSPL